MKKEMIIILAVWFLVIMYGLFIYPNPEKFPVLSSRFVSFLVTMLGLSTLFIYNKKK